MSGPGRYGSHLLLRKIDRDYDPTDCHAAMRIIDETRSKSEVLTGIIYIDTEKTSLVSSMTMTKTPLAMLEEAELRPSKDALAKLMAGYRF